jgi:branched-chain amino acid transport system substrate-binding protein
MYRRRTCWTILILITGAACARNGTRPPVVAFAYTRSSASYLDLANEALRERGAPAATYYYDSLSESESSERALAFAASIVGHSEIAVVVGPSNSRHALATAPAYNAAGLPQILPSSTSRRLRGAGPGTFVLVPDDSVEGEFLAHFAWDSLGARRAVVFFANDEYGEGLRAGISAAFTSLGGKVLDAIPTAEEMDYEAVVGSAVGRYHPDVLFSAGRGLETGTLLHEARRGSGHVPVVAGDGAYHLPSLTPAAQGDLSGLYVLAFWVYDSTNAAHRAFAARVRRILGNEPTPEDALTEDALVLAATARAEGGPDRGAVRRWLTGLGHDRPPFDGLTGPIAFGAGRQLPLAMVKFVDGKAVRVPFSLVAPGPQP